jgi:hypothetical protein
MESFVASNTFAKTWSAADYRIDGTSPGQI